MLDKARTKARTAPVAVRSPLPFEPNASWPLQNGIAASALVRGVFAQIETQGLHSGNLRGRSSTLARFANEQDASLWYVQSNDARSWKVQLGIRSTKTGEYHLDWSVRVECREESGVVDVGITTPGYLTLDKALVNGNTHDRVRDLLVAAFRGTDGGVSAAAEARIGARSLKAGSMLDETVDFAKFGDCEIRTVLPTEDLAGVLRRVGMPTVEVSPNRQVFRLGLDRPGVPQSVGTVSWDEAREADVLTLRLSFALQATGSMFLDTMAARAASSLAKRVRGYVAARDSSLRWSGPDLYSWTW